MNNSDLIEERALKRSMVGAFLLAVWGIVMAVVADSGVILLDGMFNLISGIIKILPLKEQLGAKKLGLEILKTGRRIWVTIRLDPKADTINVDEFMKAKKRLCEVAFEVYPNSQTEVLLERLG